MKHIFFILFFLVSISSACTFNKKKQTSGADYLQGKWSEDSVDNKSQLVSYQQHDFKFTCDSFYLQIKTYAKTNLNGGSCYANNFWKEYAKGYYELSGDTLKFKGNFVSKDYKYKPENSCYRVGTFEENFLLINKTANAIIIKSLQTNLTHNLTLKEKTVCKTAD